MVRVISTAQAGIVIGCSGGDSDLPQPDGLTPPVKRVRCEDPCWIYPPGFNVSLLVEVVEEEEPELATPLVGGLIV